MFEYTVCVKIEFTDIYTTKRQLRGDVDEMKKELENGVREAIEKDTGIRFDDFHADVKVFERELDLLED